MQNVAWPAITVSRLNEIPSTCVKVSDSATPVTIPGNAIGRITRNDTVSRPKKRWRATASEASVPSTSAIPVATSPTLTEVTSALPAPLPWNAWLNQWVVKPGGGHWRMFDELNA
jgi:hypothetical protein